MPTPVKGTRGRGKGHRAPEFYPIEWVKWIDAHSPAWGWNSVEEVDFERCLECQTVGFLVHEAEDRISIAACIGLDNAGAAVDIVDLVMTIPKSAIVKRVRLKI